MKQVVLIDQLDLLHFTKVMGIRVPFVLEKMGEVYFSPKKGEFDKIVEESRLLRESNL